MSSAFPNYAHSANLPFRNYVIKKLVTHTLDPYDGEKRWLESSKRFIDQEYERMLEVTWSVVNLAVSANAYCKRIET
jgi:hypothetical protein